MYTLLITLSFITILVALVLTLNIGKNQGDQDYSTKTVKRFSNLIWIYVIGIGIVVMGLLLYIYIK